MAEIVTMPKLSDTMEEGVVAEWHKKVGDQVENGELLAEIETDKATMEFDSFFDGTLLHIGVEKGKGAPVDSILAVIGEKDEDIDEILKNAKKEQSSKSDSEEKSESSSKQNEEKKEPEKETKSEQKKEKQEEPSTKKETTKKTQREEPSSNGERVFASPLAKNLAQEKGYEIGKIPGSGDHGRVIKRDVENYNPDLMGISPMAMGRANIEESSTEENVSQMRKTIAKRLSESKFTAPHFYLTLDIDMDAAIEARKKVNANDDIKISYNDMVIKASAMALRKHPAVNASWQEDTIRYNHHINVGVAVAVEEGLLVPVVRFADTKGMSNIGEEVKTYAKKAKDKKLQPEDWEGNTFTISNLGMYDIEEFTAIINPPDSCIMAIGSIKQVPVVKDGEIVPGNQMRVTLSCDHRVVDGVKGAEFLQTFKQYLENPVMMIV